MSVKHTNYAMSMFEEESNTGWNKWWVRRLLKTLSGVLIALALWGPLLNITGYSVRWNPADAFLLGMVGVFLFYAYYLLQRKIKQKMNEEGARYQPVGQ